MHALIMGGTWDTGRRVCEFEISLVCKVRSPPEKAAGFLLVVVLLVEKLSEVLIRSCVIRGHMLAGYFGSLV